MGLELIGLISFRKNKKAQIGAILAIAVSIAILAGLITLVMVDFTQNEPEQLIEEVTSGSSDSNQVSNFVSSCLNSVGKNAILQISRNGGYLNPSLSLDYSFEDYKSEYIVKGPFRLPFWYHYSDDEGSFKTHIPPLRKEDGRDSIESQIEYYVEKDIWSCLNNFASFSDRLRIKSSDVDASVTITHESVAIALDMPITISNLRSDTSSTLRDFSAIIPVSLEKIYDLARDITLTEYIYGFVETPVFELIAKYSGLGKVLPPVYEVDMFNPGSNPMWMHSDVEKFLRTQVLPKVSLLQVYRTKNFVSPRNNGLESFQGYTLQEMSVQTLIAPSHEDYYDISAEFSYPSNSEPYIKVGTGSAVLRGDTAKNDGDLGGIFAKMLGPVITKYRFPYDLSFPVMVRLCDEISFGGEGLCFNFALEGNIRNSEVYVPVSAGAQAGFGSSTGERLTVAFDDADQLVNKHVQFNVRNLTGSKISGVDIYYMCGEEFYIGKTSNAGENAYSFSGRLPFCASGGFIRLSKRGYMALQDDLLTDIREYNNLDDNNDVLLDDFVMYPEIKLALNGGKRSSDDWFTTNRELGSGDQVLVEISKRKQTSIEDDYPLVSMFILGDTEISDLSSNAQKMQSIVQEASSLDIAQGLDSEIASLNMLTEIHNESAAALPEMPNYERSISLVPGEYDVKITYIVSGDPAVVIPEEKRRVCLNGEKRPGEFCFIETDSYTLPEIEIPSWVVSEINYVWRVSESIYGANSITFYAADFGLPKTHDSLEAGVTTDYNQYANKFLPEVE